MKYKILDKRGKIAQLERRLRDIEKTHYNLTVYVDVLGQQIPNETGPEQQRLAAELADAEKQLRQCETEMSVLKSHLKDVQ